MPCSDGRNVSSYQEVQLSQRLSELERENKQLDAILCAIMNEVERVVDASDLSMFLTNATECGQVDVRSWWKDHQRKDFKRLEKELERFSADELIILDKIFKNRSLLRANEEEK